MRLHPAMNVVLVYAAVALPWVLATDLLVRVLAPSPASEHTLGSINGAGFVAVTALLLYFFVRRRFDVLIGARTAAEDREALFRGLIESVGDVVFTAGRDLRCTGLYGPWVTPEAVEGMTGRLPTEIFGEEVGLRQMQVMAQVLGGAQVSVDWLQQEEPLLILPLDESVRGLRISMSPLRDASGAIVGIVGTGRDISPLLAAEQDRDAHKQRLDWLAFHDALTDLPNRLLLHDRLEQGMARADREGHQVAVHFVDVDAFKDVNDTFGHGVGDELIRAVGKRLSQLIRQSDTVARQGGDEFILVQERVSTTIAAARMADRIIQAFAVPFSVEGQDMYISVSVGVALYPTDAASVPDLLRAADTALHEAKEAGRNRFGFYAAAMGEAARDRLERANALRAAVRAREIRVAVQPIVEARTGRVVGVEALARWHDPVLGEIPPAEFIALAEAGGFVHEIGMSVRRQAFAWLAWWREQGMDLEISVNASPPTVRRIEFAERLQLEAHEHGIPPERITVEVTESVLIGEDGGPVAALQRLRNLGFRIAIDDYGTGYASVGYLRRLPVSVLKLAREFTAGALSDERDREIVRSTIALGRHLGLAVIAEGIEREEERALMVGLRADYLQGYLIAPPMPPEEFERWCHDYRGAVGLRTQA